MNRLIISAPFGNYFRPRGATPTCGTFTLRRRGGVLYRLWRCARTLRYSRTRQAWTNRLGLPNPGIDSARRTGGTVVSVHGFDAREWDDLAARAAESRPLAVELNLSCPNVGRSHAARDVAAAVRRLLEGGVAVVAKLPPVRWDDLAAPLYDLGVSHFHLCNTLPTPAGAVSGKPLKPYALRAVEACRRRWGGAVELIGGGGVTCERDVRDYLDAGADRVAVGSMLLNPLNWRKIPRFVRLLGKFPKES